MFVRGGTVLKKATILFLFVMMTTVFLNGCGSPSDMQGLHPIGPTELQNGGVGIWDQFFVYPIVYLMNWIANVLLNNVYGNYGFAIILITIIIRFFLLPLNIRQVKSSKAMQALNPEIQKLREKYSSKDRATQQKLSEETMSLFQKYNVNPLSGCFILILQMPILFALYHAISRYTPLQTHQFLWFQLGVPDPIYLLPVLAGVTTFFQSKLTMSSNAAGANPQMAVLLYLMPIMVAGFGLFFPSALTLYWLIGNLFMIAQTMLIKVPDLKIESTTTKPGGAKK